MKHFLRQLRYDGPLYIANRIVARIPSHTIRLWFYRHVMKYTIGRGSYIFMDAWVDCKEGFSMGINSVINRNCRLDTRGTITIGDNVSISADVAILTADHDPNSPDFAGRVSPIKIEDYVFIGTRAMILPGVTLGRGAVVAAGAVVTKTVEPHSIVAGVPARKIGERNTDLRYSFPYYRLFA